MESTSALFKKIYTRNEHVDDEILHLNFATDFTQSVPCMLLRHS